MSHTLGFDYTDSEDESIKKPNSIFLHFIRMFKITYIDLFFALRSKLVHSYFIVIRRRNFHFKLELIMVLSLYSSDRHCSNNIMANNASDLKLYDG